MRVMIFKQIDNFSFTYLFLKKIWDYSCLSFSWIMEIFVLNIKRHKSRFYFTCHVLNSSSDCFPFLYYSPWHLLHGDAALRWQWCMMRRSRHSSRNMHFMGLKDTMPKMEDTRKDSSGRRSILQVHRKRTLTFAPRNQESVIPVFEVLMIKEFVSFKVYSIIKICPCYLRTEYWYLQYSV